MAEKFCVDPDHIMHFRSDVCRNCGKRKDEHPDYDPTPWCSGCGAMRKVDCHCGPIAENE